MPDFSVIGLDSAGHTISAFTCSDDGGHSNVQCHHHTSYSEMNDNHMYPWAGKHRDHQDGTAFTSDEDSLSPDSDDSTPTTTTNNSHGEQDQPNQSHKNPVPNDSTDDDDSSPNDSSSNLTKTTQSKSHDSDDLHEPSGNAEVSNLPTGPKKSTSFLFGSTPAYGQPGMASGGYGGSTYGGSPYGTSSGYGSSGYGSSPSGGGMFGSRPPTPGPVIFLVPTQGISSCGGMMNGGMMGGPNMTQLPSMFSMGSATVLAAVSCRGGGYRDFF